MSDLDALLLATQLLSANHTAADQLINAALYYGPGIFLTALIAAGWHTLRWILRRYDQWAADRAERRHYTAVAHRLNTVADNTDQIIADAGNQLAEQLLQQIYDTHEEEK